MLGRGSNSGGREATMWTNQAGKSKGLLPGRESLGPLLLMGTTPVFIFILWHTLKNLDGDVLELCKGFSEKVGFTHPALGMLAALPPLKRLGSL